MPGRAEALDPRLAQNFEWDNCVSEHTLEVCQGDRLEEPVAKDGDSRAAEDRSSGRYD
jgi:hypothetical protein